MSRSVRIDCKGKTLDEVLRVVSFTEEQFDLIKNGSRKRDLTPIKAEYTKIGIELGYTMDEIASNIKITKQAINKFTFSACHQK
jgi:putative transposase